MKCMNLVSAQSLLGEVEIKTEMQIYTELWDRKEPVPNCLERSLKPAWRRKYLLSFGIVPP